ncbi:ABC transporter ATP-binding protein [Inhella gelatinilytica]|uniref:ABC transporter ATP-binding protein n=1 Tax=Inhella gelatinilytica TaxID=2795030 RepID=A0A931IWR6_9BURK|nr:ABC transporter ATP-binding protein [Inhella gelatinilytica]MBH9553317.1 ABC transporter ATP-binding protein [Inhella gelatinilytica]
MTSQSDDGVIELRGVAKRYATESRPWARLWRQLRGTVDQGPVHEALVGVDLSIRRGELVGLIGSNGAGKSTLLQLVCGVLQPSAGEVRVQGRIAAILELGAGFNPELTGRENVRFCAPLLGLSPQETEAKLPDILAFAEIGDFVDQPVRSYSSGMFVRLAFALATSVQPDILVIDEALAVGDEAFARKSFKRIMALREAGATILFCSHALFQVEALCPRAVWLNRGRIAFDGPSAEAIVRYRAHLGVQGELGESALQENRFDTGRTALKSVRVESDERVLRSGEDELVIAVEFASDPNDACPVLGVVVQDAEGRSIMSAGSWLDAQNLVRDDGGAGRVRLCFPQVGLLKGRYYVSAYLMCERGIQVRSAAEHVVRFEVKQTHLEQGVVHLPRTWTVEAGGA